MKKLVFFFIAFALLGGALVASQQAVQAQDAAPDANKVALGKALFFDQNLSANGTQSCATCHAVEVGYTGPDSAVNKKDAVYQGAIPNRFGNRKPPAAAYAGDSPALGQVHDAWFGGMFWDGRATGKRLGDPLAEQAQGPFLNPLEQALPNAQVLCVRVKNSPYAGLFDQAWGAGSLDCSTPAAVDKVYEQIGRSVAAYERSSEVNLYTSKFDLFWDKAAEKGKNVAAIKCGMGGGMGGGSMGGAMGCPGGGANGWQSFRNLGLTDAELQGLAVFNDPNRGNCASCHSLAPGSAGYPLFTDFGYDNIGTPKNPDNPFYTMPKAWNPDGKNWVDYGLGAFLKSAGYPAEVYGPEMGKHKVPTLRNVDLRPSADTIKAYGHNGFFKSLDDIVFFYHWRACMDSGMNCGGMGGGGMGGGMGGMCPQMGSGDMAVRFPPPEVDENRATLSMFPCPQVNNVVVFLKTLSDGYFTR